MALLRQLLPQGRSNYRKLKLEIHFNLAKTLFPKKKVSEMTREERIAVCYQYTCLLYEDGQAINNQTVRERFNLNKNQTVMASRILADTLESGLIKMKDPETESKRYSSYIPYYG